MNEALKDLYRKLLIEEYKVYEVKSTPDKTQIRIEQRKTHKGISFRYRAYRYELLPTYAHKYDESYGQNDGVIERAKKALLCLLSYGVSCFTS